MKMNQEELRKSLSLVKSTALLKCHNFYSSIIVSLKYKFVDENITAHTNGCTVTIGIGFWSELNDKERLFLLLHETMHIILMHVQRFKDLSYKDKNPELYNLAADFFINLTLKNDNNNGAYQLIEGGCLDQKYTGFSTEEIYKDLLQKITSKNNGNSNPNGIGGIGNDLAPDNKTGDSLEQKEVENIIKSAAIQNARNKDYSSSTVFMNEITLLLIEPPRVNWKTALQRYMNVKFRKGRTYQKPNRRTMFNRKLCIKAPKTDVRIGDLLVYIDVSGSCEESDIKNMATELYHIMAMYKPDSILFSTFNTEIQQTFKLTTPKDIPTDLMISGGTEIQCVTDHINAHKNKGSKVCVSILMSDFWSGHWDKPETPLIMLVVNNPDFISDYGLVIHYNPD